ncbi:hypothetical protein Bbelb_338860 [Branchiostoma belcheri]|nr:hypothetical protein Bbelb_338860 [Branchiostoma belcheri]
MRPGGLPEADRAEIWVRLCEKQWEERRQRRRQRPAQTCTQLDVFTCVNCGKPQQAMHEDILNHGAYSIVSRDERMPTTLLNTSVYYPGPGLEVSGNMAQLLTF